eukprot:m.136808 g.136808  ORF g.136808 m.136808 type:complete len:285 (-) comp29881_c0_seq1:62-916(-)
MAAVVPKTVAPLKYFSSWFCPFAHRATIALEHHHVPYKWEEALGWQQHPPTGKENFEAADRTDWWYHWKSPALIAANPLGMVPTLLEESSGRAVVESINCIQFIDEYAAKIGSTQPSLLSTCPFERANERVAAETFNKSVCSNYYKVLVRTDHTERKQGFEQLCEGLLDFTSSCQGGDYFGGRSSPGLVDCTVFPHAFRLYAIEHYRGREFALPTSSEDGLWQRYHAWLQRMSSLPSVKKTLPGKERYIQHVGKYANAQARSKIGNAVKRGVAAHDYDDKLDNL